MLIEYTSYAKPMEDTFCRRTQKASKQNAELGEERRVVLRMEGRSGWGWEWGAGALRPEHSVLFQEQRHREGNEKGGVLDS